MPMLARERYVEDVVCGLRESGLVRDEEIEDIARLLY
jgi:hypothetical protein